MKLVAVLMLVIIGLSCTSPFSGRDSEFPSESQGTFITPVEPEIVLLNLEASYNEKIISNFLQCLDTSFFFTFDFLQFADIPDSGWGYDIERVITDNMFNFYRAGSDSVSLSLTLRPIQSLPGRKEDTLAILYREYELETVSSLDKATPDTVTYNGTAEFEITQTSGNLWMLRRWLDQHASPQDTAWSDFKNGFR